MSEAFERAWAKTGRAEGGYVDDPDDPGGETNHGITARVARASGYFGPMSEMPRAVATEIAKREYWDKLRLDDVTALSEPIAAELFDTNLNLWDGAAGKFLQRALNGFNRNERDYPDLWEDGRIGLVTIAALRSYLAHRADEKGEEVLLAALNAQQGADYLRQAREVPGKEKFTFGWFKHRVAI